MQFLISQSLSPSPFSVLCLSISLSLFSLGLSFSFLRVEIYLSFFCLKWLVFSLRLRISQSDGNGVDGFLQVCIVSPLLGSPALSLFSMYQSFFLSFFLFYIFLSNQFPFIPRGSKQCFDKVNHCFISFFPNAPCGFFKFNLYVSVFEGGIFANVSTPD